MRNLSLRNILLYLSAFLIVVESGTMFVAFSDFYSLFDKLKVATMLVLLFLVFNTGYKIKSPKLTQLNLFLFIYLLGSYTLFNSSTSQLFLNFTEILIINLLYIFIINTERYHGPYIFIAYRNIILLLAVSSLFLWLLGPILNLIEPSAYLVSNWSVHREQIVSSYYFLCFTTEEIDYFGLSVLANNSIFGEKAFAATVFGTGLLYELFIPKKRKFLNIVVFTLAILSTCSVTGTLITLFSYTLFVWALKRKSNFSNFLVFLFAPLLLYIVYQFTTDVISAKVLTYSGESRSTDISNGLRSFLNHPLFGFGMNNIDIVKKYETGYSSSLSNVLMRGGVWLLSVYVIPIYRAIKNGIENKNKNIICFAVIFAIMLIFNNTAFNYNTYYILLFLALYQQYHFAYEKI